MPTAIHYQTGDRVKFNARGRILSGVILRTRMHRRRGKARELAELVTGNPGSLDRMVAEIQVDEPRTGIWTVGLGSITELLPEKANAAQLGAAFGTLREIKQRNSDRQFARRRKNDAAAEQAGLESLNIGDPIEVEFRDCAWQPARFNGFVSGSGNVRFIFEGRNRTTAPQFVRLPKAEQSK
jgi:hypothetical protein